MTARFRIRLPVEGSCDDEEEWVDVFDHRNQTSRGEFNSHPQVAIGGRGEITNLELDQISQDRRIDEASYHSERVDNPHEVVHTQLSDVAANLTHQEIDDELARLEQIKLDIADAVAAFSFAAYADMTCPEDSAFPDIGLTWQKVDILTLQRITPKGISIDLVNSTFSFDSDGVYRLSLVGSMEHDSVNNGRKFQIRIYNETDQAAGQGVTIGTGRNAEATSIPASFLAEISDEDKGDEFILEIGNGDVYSGVSFQTLILSINAVSEWREPLG